MIPNQELAFISLEESSLETTERSFLVQECSHMVATSDHKNFNAKALELTSLTWT
jgi:hypothetical protein